MRFLLLLTLFACTGLPSHEASAKYQRKHWRHWTDRDRNCLNTRQEILKARSLTPVILNEKGCKVVAGRWHDYYFPEVLEDPKKVDIDHLIPLKHAHENGGAGWSRKQKEAFANDPENLVITNRKYNRQKGAQGIDTWLPLHREYACKYMHDWMRVKNKYALQISESERHAVSGCSNK